MKRLLIALTVAATLVAGAQINSPRDTAITSSGSDEPSGALATLSPDEIVLANYVQSLAPGDCVSVGNPNAGGNGGGVGGHRLEWSFTASDIAGVPGGVTITGATASDGSITVGLAGGTVTVDNGANEGNCQSDAAKTFTTTVNGTLSNGGTFTVTLTGWNP